jgi:Asp-tRNA(Asn)/Glu-tRNA(Gln) amidotransferase A subunit family amidase
VTPARFLGRRQRSLEESTIAELAAGMASGRLSAKNLVSAYLSSIGRLDRGRIDLRSDIETNPDALAIAA